MHWICCAPAVYTTSWGMFCVQACKREAGGGEREMGKGREWMMSLCHQNQLESNHLPFWIYGKNIDRNAGRVNLSPRCMHTHTAEIVVSCISSDSILPKIEIKKQSLAINSFIKIVFSCGIVSICFMLFWTFILTLLSLSLSPTPLLRSLSHSLSFSIFIFLCFSSLLLSSFIYFSLSSSSPSNPSPPLFLS